MNDPRQGLHPSDAIVALVAYFTSGDRSQAADQAIICLTSYYAGEVKRYQTLLAAQGEFAHRLSEEVKTLRESLKTEVDARGQDIASLNEELANTRRDLKTAQQVNEQQAETIKELRTYDRGDLL